MIKFIASFFLSSVLGCVLSAHAQDAQEYPTKPVKIIVSFTAGGTTDIIARGGAGWRFAQSELTPERLSQLLISIFNDPMALSRRAAAAHALATPNAASKLADVVEQLAAPSSEKRSA